MKAWPLLIVAGLAFVCGLQVGALTSRQTALPAPVAETVASDLPIGRLLVRRMELGSAAPVEVWHPTVSAMICKNHPEYAIGPFRYPLEKAPCAE